MKYINKLCAASMVILAASCSKELNNNDSYLTKQAILTAELSQPEDENGTKTYLDGLDVKWSSDDAIAVFANNATEFKKYTLSEGSGTTLGEFSGDEVTAAYAYYPYKGVTSVDGSNNLSVVIPRVQTYSASSFGQYDMPMLATASGSGLSFHNLMAVLKLQLTGTDIIDRIIVIANTAGTKLSGMATVATNGSITFSTTDGEAYNWVELDCGTTGVDLSSNNTFYISVPAGSYSFTVRIVSKSATVAPDKTVASAKTFTANKIKPMTSYSVEFGTDFKYVDGAYVGDPVSVTIDETQYKWAPVNCGYDGSFRIGKIGRFYQYGRKYGQYGGKTITPTTESRTVVSGSDIFNENKFYSALSEYYYSWVYNAPEYYNSGKTEYDPCPVGWRTPSSTELAKLIGCPENQESIDGHHIGMSCRYQSINDGGDTMYGFWYNGMVDNPENQGLFLYGSVMRYYATGTSNIDPNDDDVRLRTYEKSGFSANMISASCGVYVLEPRSYKDVLTTRSMQPLAHGVCIRCIKE